MGFGLLFVGYLFAFGYTVGANYILSLVGAVGTIFLICAGRRLCVYSRAFRYLIYLSAALGAMYLLHAGADISVRYFAVDGELARSLIHSACNALSLLCNLAVYFGCFKVASLADDRPLQSAALRNFVINMICFAMRILLLILPASASAVGGALAVAANLSELILLVLNVFMTLNFYIRIRPEGDDASANR